VVVGGGEKDEEGLFKAKALNEEEEEDLFI